MKRRREGLVPEAVVEQITEALDRVDGHRALLEQAVAGSSPLENRRRLRAELREASETADRLLRRATALTKGRSHQEWSRWCKRLASLSTATQKSLFAERDDAVGLSLGTVQALDTGMSGPSIGELQHGRSKEPGAPARYGLDLDALFAPPAPRPSVPSPSAPSPAPAVTSPSTPGVAAERLLQAA